MGFWMALFASLSFMSFLGSGTFSLTRWDLLSDALFIASIWFGGAFVVSVFWWLYLGG